MDLKLRVAICDDEKYFREEIKRLVEQYLKEKKIIFCIDLFTSGLEFCSDDNNLQQYDIIFLDIGMKEMNGMETAYAIREKNQNVDIVFITIMMDYALEGYRVDAVRYILKDDLESLLPECMDTILQKKQEKEIHIVGLYINPDDPELLKMTAEFRECRDKRNEKMIAALQEEGFPITMEALLAENTDSVITRANIARFLYEHGWIKSVSEAFDKYIGDGCRCYVGRFKVSPMEAVSLIKRTGGIAILAHPLLYHLGVEQLQLLIDDLKAVGLDGIEAIYSTYTTGEEQLVKRIAKENKLLISGGSDFHGENKPAIKLGTGRGHLYIPYSVLTDIKARAGK